ncbi:MAG: DEAD/DEAH box helicase, partial [Pseudomonadota bacterium]
MAVKPTETKPRHATSPLVTTSCDAQPLQVDGPNQPTDGAKSGTKFETKTQRRKTAGPNQGRRIAPQNTAVTPETRLPQRFANWFASRGWTVRAHQLELLEKVQAGRSALLIAPTGAGKTLAGFLPSLIELTTPDDMAAGAEAGSETASSNKRRTLTSEARGAGLHTLYISPLKALAVDVARNLERPIVEMGLSIVAETRTGDTNAAKRTRQRTKPPHIL